jgi:Zn-dependent protease
MPETSGHSGGGAAFPDNNPARAPRSAPRHSGGSIPLGRAFGIPLYLHITFFLLPAYVAFVQRGEGSAGILFGLAAVLAVFGCVLLHELGHALMARYYGIRTRDITLYPIGGVARLDSTGEKPAQELAIALAGPAVNLLFVVVLAPVVLATLATGLLTADPLRLVLAQGAPSLLARFALTLWVSNLVLLLFNLMPAFPMDGGRVLRAILSAGLPRLRATEIAVGVGVLMAILFGAVAALLNSPMLLLVALFVCFAGQAELRGLRHQEAQRRAAEAQQAAAAYPPVVVVQPAAGGTEGGGFTGLVWDRDLRVWVRWQNGRPVQIHS